MGRDQPPMGNAPPSFMEPGPRIPYGSSRRTAYPAPALSTGKDVKDSLLPRTYRQAWWNWESAKHEFENMGTRSGVIWFVDENEAVNRILEIVGRDEIAMAITNEDAKEHDAIKEGRAHKRRRKYGLTSEARIQVEGT